jgi:hypothetical protein
MKAIKGEITIPSHLRTEDPNASAYFDVSLPAEEVFINHVRCLFSLGNYFHSILAPESAKWYDRVKQNITENAKAKHELHVLEENEDLYKKYFIINAASAVEMEVIRLAYDEYKAAMGFELEFGYDQEAIAQRRFFWIEFNDEEFIKAMDAEMKSMEDRPSTLTLELQRAAINRMSDDYHINENGTHSLIYMGPNIIRIDVEKMWEYLLDTIFPFKLLERVFHKEKGTTVRNLFHEMRPVKDSQPKGIVHEPQQTSSLHDLRRALWDDIRKVVSHLRDAGRDVNLTIVAEELSFSSRPSFYDVMKKAGIKHDAKNHAFLNDKGKAIRYGRK